MSKKYNILSLVNEIIQLAEVGHRRLLQNNIKLRSFDFSSQFINFRGENYNKYTKAISQLFNEDSDIKNTYILKSFESLFMEFLSEFILANKLVNKDNIDSFFEELKTKPIKTFSVLKNIYGIKLENTNKPFNLGQYTIYYSSEQKKLIESKTSNDINIWDGDQPEYLIEFTVKAREFNKAKEIANEKFEMFENVIRYITGHPTHRFDVGIINYDGWKNDKTWVFSDDGGFSHSSNLKGSIELLPLDDKLFTCDEFQYVWKLVNANNLNEFEKRISLAIQWIGESVKENLPQTAFLKAAIALEIIFTYQEKSIITPSIMNQISESIALILGESCEKRVDIESKVKKLYGLRSKIVHSGNKDITKSDYHKMFEISRSVVHKLMTSAQLSNIASIEKLYEFFKKVKYSGTQIS